jgi:hypothetical protein
VFHTNCWTILDTLSDLTVAEFNEPMLGAYGLQAEIDLFSCYQFCDIRPPFLRTRSKGRPIQSPVATRKVY